MREGRRRRETEREREREREREGGREGGSLLPLHPPPTALWPTPTGAPPPSGL